RYEVGLLLPAPQGGLCICDRRWRGSPCVGRGEPARCTNVPAASVPGVESVGVERDDHLGGLWFVRLQASLVILPAGDLDNTRGDLFFVCLSRRFQNIEAAIVEKERMLPKYLAQGRDRWMIVRKHLGVELTEGLFDQCGCKPHLMCSFLLGHVQMQKTPPAIARTGPPTQAGGT